MKIKLLSDLHLEGRRGYWTKPHPWSTFNNEDVLVLAGDIAVGTEAVLQAIDYFQTQGFEQIVYTLGNHEYYHHDYGMHGELKTAVKAQGVHFLDCEEIIKIQDVSFFGGTLWTTFDHDPIAQAVAKTNINDFRVVKNWTTEKCAKESTRQQQFIKLAYEQTEGKKCIVTHFMPAKAAIAERFKVNGIESTLNAYFANGLDDWISTLEDTVWLFGHTHDAMDFKLGNTRLVSNPLGYSNEYTPEFARFVNNKVIEL